jgi:hypothetical protein
VLPRVLVLTHPFPAPTSTADEDAYLHDARAGGFGGPTIVTHDLLRIPIRMGYEAAAFTSATILFSTAGVHSVSAYDVGHIGPSSRFAASSNPSVA